MDRTQWIDDLKRVGEDLFIAESSHAIFTKVSHTATDATWIDHSGGLMRHLSVWHRDYLLLALRRETDTDRRSVSLVRLIDDVASKRIRFTRLEFAAHYKRNGLAEWGEVPNKRFDELCDRQNSDEYPANRAKRHREWVKRVASEVTKLVNKEIAHRDRIEEPNSIRKQHVRRVLWSMRQLQAHYEELATGSTAPPEPIRPESMDLPELESPWAISSWHRGLCSLIRDPR